MIKKLQETLQLLPNLLQKSYNWDSLIVNKRKPHTYRVFHKFDNGLRVCLHKFDKCSLHEAFAHPHPWPGAFIILSGKYQMKIGYSKDKFSQPDQVAKFILNKWSAYEIVNPLTWHSVVPLDTTYTVMVNGEAFTEDIAHTSTVTTKGKDLDKMPDNELQDHLDIFSNLVKEYLENLNA